jgi:hypothetical protein
MRYFHEILIEDFYDVLLHDIIYLIRRRSVCLLYFQHCHELPKSHSHSGSL